MAQIEQMETTVSKMTNTLGKINSRIDIAKENISVLEYLAIKTSKMKHTREQRFKIK